MTYSLRTTAEEAERRIGRIARTAIAVITEGEEEYQDLVDAWIDAGSDNNKWARRLFALPRTDQEVLTIDATAKTVSCVTGLGLFSLFTVGQKIDMFNFAQGGNNVAGERITAKTNDVLTLGNSTTLVNETGSGDEYVEVVASNDQATFVQDIRDAATALHEIYGALTNVATSTADRITELRKFA